MSEGMGRLLAGPVGIAATTLAKDMLATIQNAQRGFSAHPKKYRDYYNRAKKLGLVE